MTPAVLALERQGQKCQKLKVTLNDVVNSRLGWAMGYLASKNKIVLGVVAHDYSSKTWDTEAGGLMRALKVFAFKIPF